VAEKKFLVTFKGKEGRQHMTLLANDKEEAQRLAESYQHRRHARFPLTFARLDHALATGESGGLAISPLGGKSLTEAAVKAEIEKRKRDQARYDSGELKVESVEEVK
jgi:hypothetical protein